MKFTITRQFLVPHYQHVIIEAASVEEACQIAAGVHPTIEEPDWDYQSGAASVVREDWDSVRDTEIERVVAGEWLHHGEPNPYGEPSGLEPTVLPIPQIWTTPGTYTTEGGDRDERLRAVD